ncbi:MAG: hypothetical protein MJE77_24075 [Proteobacteria bacterium]|nr:hypothetical protein [Pseudomonadota bacterium]
MPDTPKFDDIDLMLYADGEVDEALAARVEAYLDENSDARAKVEAIRQMDDTLRSYLELAADDQESRLSAMWDTIEHNIRADSTTARQALSARETESAPGAEPRSEPGRLRDRAERQDTDGIWSAIGRWLEGYRGHVLTGAAAVAAAALLVIALRPSPTVVVERGGVANPGNPGSMNVSSTAPVHEPNPPQVEHLDVTGGSGTVFVMPRDGKDDVSATVIFVDMNDVEGPL